MKQLLACVAVFAVVVGGYFLCSGSGKQYGNYDVIRVHIRANSNEDVDQNVKFNVKDEIVKLLTPLLADVTERSAAYEIVKRQLPLIEQTAGKVLSGAGFGYGCRARLCEEEFPTRSYDGIVFEGGVYTALILELGEAEGNNWWCVMYPPLCFINAEYTGGTGVQYKSKLLELLEKLKR